MNAEQLMLLLTPRQTGQQPKTEPQEPCKQGAARSAPPLLSAKMPPWQGDSDAGLILPLILILLTDGNNFGLVLALLYILM